MGSSRRKFSAEFKEKAVLEVIERSRSIADVARELDIVAQTLGNWVADYRAEHDGNGEALTREEKAEIRAPRKRVAELEEENRFLGKAAALDARESR